ncbi:hypothetical protein Adi01nite_12580 [Amorphoplanes digitatis]|nr:hypothetical protein GCM10020092_048460 [Actinoplanes digitatis]GID91846.1 hypothetical protein Adi01nite_12580 [Actinoplanes digitatis]
MWARLQTRQQSTKIRTRLAAGFEVGVGTARRYVQEVIALLTAAADDLATVMRKVRVKAYVILDGTLIPIDQVDDQKPYYCPARPTPSSTPRATKVPAAACAPRSNGAVSDRSCHAGRRPPPGRTRRSASAASERHPQDLEDPGTSAAGSTGVSYIGGCHRVHVGDEVPPRPAGAAGERRRARGPVVQARHMR